MRIVRHCPEFVRQHASNGMGSVLVAILLGALGLVVPIGGVPAWLRALIAFCLPLVAWGVWEGIHRWQSRKWPRWEMPPAALVTDFGQSYIQPSIGRELMAKFEVAMGHIRVEQDSITLDRAELVWKTWPLFIFGYPRFRLQAKKVSYGGSELPLPLPLYNRGGGLDMRVFFDEMLSYQIHDDALRHSRLFLSLTVAGHKKERCVAEVKMR